MIISYSTLIKKLLLVFLIFAGLYFAKNFLVPLATAAILAALFIPLCKWLEKKKCPRGLAALVCVLCFLLCIAGIIALMSWQVAALTDDVGLLKQRGAEIIQQSKEYISAHFGLSVRKQEQMLNDQQDAPIKFIPELAGSLFYVMSYLILTMVYIFLFVYYRTHIKDFLLKIASAEKRNETQQVIYQIGHVAQQYLVGLAKMIFCLWVMYGIGFSIIGIKNAFFFAILCGMLEIIPFIGNLTGTTITLLVSAVQGASMGMLGGILITYGIVQLIQGWVLEPVIVGPQVKINPMATILALVLGELIWGIPGVLLAIPLTAMLKIVCDHIEPLKPLGFLIGKVKPEKKESAFSRKIKRWFKKQSG